MHEVDTVFTFASIHLADTFIQSNKQMSQYIHCKETIMLSLQNQHCICIAQTEVWAFSTLQRPTFLN